MPFWRAARRPASAAVSSGVPFLINGLQRSPEAEVLCRVTVVLLLFISFQLRL